MKILIANKFYYRRGGDCIYALNLEQMLRDRGHEVAVFAMDYPENLPTPWQKYFPKNMTRLMALTRPFGSREVRRKFSALLDDFTPEVVHLNNIHTHLSPVIAELAHARGIRTVWTLHDYKLLCPRYDCMLGGMNPCQRCFGDNKRGCLDYSCIKGSKLQSAVGYREARHWSRRRLERAVDMFICPSAFMAHNMKAGGFDPAKLTVLNNFIDTDRWLASAATTSADIDSLTAEPYYCYVGRLSREKGVRTLVEAAAMNSRRLILIGNGPLEAELRSKAGRNVVFAGFRTPADVRVLVGRARMMVLPSECYENNPLSVIEAQIMGTPTLGADIGGIPELIDPGVSGDIFESGNPRALSEATERLWDMTFDRNAISRNAISRFNADTYYKKLTKLYH